MLGFLTNLNSRGPRRVDEISAQWERLEQKPDRAGMMDGGGRPRFPRGSLSGEAPSEGVRKGQWPSLDGRRAAGKDGRDAGCAKKELWVFEGHINPKTLEGNSNLEGSRSVVTTRIPVGLEGTDSCPKHYKDLGAQACGCYCGFIQPLSKIVN